MATAIDVCKYLENDMMINLIKNMYSHIHDALQYMMLGAGEGSSLIAGQKPVKAFNARKGFDIFKRTANVRKQRFILE